MTSTGDVSTLTMVGDAVRKAFKEITSLTGHETTFAGLVKFAIRLSTTARGSYGGRYTGVLLLTGENITPDLYENTVYQLSADGMRSMCEVLQTKISCTKNLR